MEVMQIRLNVLREYLKTVATLFIAIFAISHSAQARLGETEVACAMRYNHGQDVGSTISDQVFPLISGVNTTNRTYSYQGWTIRIGFHRGIAHCIQYQHVKATERITDAEVSEILQANGGIDAWSPELKGWSRKDGAKAALSSALNSLTLESAAYFHWRMNKGKKPPPKPIPNF